MSDSTSGKRMTDRAKDRAAKLTSDEARTKAVGAVKQGGQQLKGGARHVAKVANRGLSKGVGKVSLRDYRQSMEAAMAQIIEVLSAHEAEIMVLRARLARLDGEGG